VFYAGGSSVRDIARHLRDLYGAEIGRDTISRITDAVLEDVAAWRTRPLKRVPPELGTASHTSPVGPVRFRDQGLAARSRITANGKVA
jgi:hypothetical protein